jgi:D-lactate dehydrogenase
MGIEKPAIAVFDAKPYDRDYIARASGADKLHWRFQQFRLDNKTVLAADGAQAVCTFVNDVVNREILERLAGSGIRLVALAALPFAFGAMAHERSQQVRDEPKKWLRNEQS